VFVCEAAVCDTAKPRLIAKPLDVLVLELFFIVGLLFCRLGFDFIYIFLSLSFSPLLHLRLSIRTLESIDVRSANAVFGDATISLPHKGDCQAGINVRQQIVTLRARSG